MNLTCATHFCGGKLLGCLADGDCDKALACSAGCMANWSKDPTRQKVHAQNCTTKCAASYADSAYDAAMGCLMQHNCVSEWCALPGARSSHAFPASHSPRPEGHATGLLCTTTLASRVRAPQLSPPST